MRAAWAVGMVVAIVACHRGPEVEPWPERELGDFSFRVTATPLYGKFTILPDTVMLDAQQQSCRRVGTGVRDSWVHHFRCFGGSAAVNVTVNSRRPQLSTWSMVTGENTTPEECLRYETRAGQRVCTRTRKAKTETVREGGLLDVTRIASAEKP